MSGSTPELSLATPEGTDDSRNYLIVGLGNALVTLDSLFNATTGHNHSGPHQGGPIAPDSLVPPVDLPGVFRSTNSTGIPSAGAGLEMYYDPTGPRGVLQAYDRDAGQQRGLALNGSSIALNAGGTVRMTVQSDGHVLMGTGTNTGIYFPNGSNIRDGGADAFGNQLVIINALTVTPGRLHAAGLTVNGTTTFNGSVSVAGNDIYARYFHSNDGGNAIYYADVGDLYLRPPSGNTVRADQGSFACSFDITAGRNMGVVGNISCGTLNVGAMATLGGMTTGGDVVASGFQANGGNVWFEGSRQVRISWNPSQGRLDIPYGNGILCSHVGATGGVFGARGVFGSVGVTGGNGAFFVRPGRPEVTNYKADPATGYGGPVALVLNGVDHLDHIFMVYGGAMGTSGWEVTSSRKYKDNIVPLRAQTAVDIIQRQDVQGYYFTSKLESNKPHVGFIAEEWAEVLPEAVSRVEGEVNSMTYDAVLPVLFMAMKAVLGRLDALEEKAA